ncbi:MAG: hypothetical protein RBU37_21210 [Myxococcota bacterium]|jgi:hypothetical protein|nr:hypothetical protein [Myxococcota bacterium]
MDLETLKQLASDGDLEAAEQLWTEADRAGDADLALLACTASGNLEHFEALAKRLWEAGQWKELAALCEAFGFVLDKERAEAIAALLKAAHGRRKVRLLSPEAVLATVAEAVRSTEAWAFRHGGSHPSSPSRPRTTVCLVVLHQPSSFRGEDEDDDEQGVRAERADTLVVGIADAGSSSPSPGAGWSSLSPWRTDRQSVNVVKLKMWAASDDLDGRLRLQRSRVNPPKLPTVSPPDAPDLVEEQLRAVETQLAEGNLDKAKEAFTALLRVFEKWKLGEESLLAAVTRSERRLASVPDAIRVASKSWFARAAKGKPLPSDRLVRHLCREALPRQMPLESLNQLALQRSSLSIRRLEVSLQAGADEAALLALRDFAKSPMAAQLRELQVDGWMTFGAGSFPLQACSGGFPALESLAIRALVDPAGLNSLALPSLRELTAPLSASALEALLRSPTAPQLHTLSLGWGDEPERLTMVLAESEKLAAVQRLELGLRLPSASDGWRRLGQAASLRPRQLLLSHVGVDAAVMTALLKGALLQRLEFLDLGSCFLGAKGFGAMADAEVLGALQYFRASHGYGRNDEGEHERTFPERFAHARFVPQLRWLSLVGWRFEANALSALAERFGAIERLSIRAAELTADAVEALAQSDGLGALEHLELSFNPIGARGLAALLRSPKLGALQRLELQDCGIGPEGLQPLVDGSAALPSLRTLILNQNPLGNEGAGLLTQSDWPSQLSWLALHQTKITKKGIELLAAARPLEGRFTGLPGYSSIDRKMGWSFEPPPG